MSFLQPLALLGLCLILAPVVIHLLNLLRYKKQDWAATQFLLKAEKKSSKFSRLRHWLPLLLRILALLALTFLAARPILQEGTGWWSLSAYQPSTVVCLLDRSSSMGRPSAQANQSLQDMAQKQILSVLRDHPKQEIILFDTLGREPLIINDTMVKNQVILDKFFSPTDTSAHLPNSIIHVMKWLERESIGKAKIKVYSDMQNNSWKLQNSAETLATIRQALSRNDKLWELQVHPLQSSTSMNRSIAIEKIFKGIGYIQPHLAIDRSKNIQETITLEIDVGERTQTLDLNLSASKNLLSPKIRLPANNDSPWVRLRIPLDSAPFDNTAYFTTDSQEPKKILVYAEDKKVEEIIVAAAQVKQDLVISLIDLTATKPANLSAVDLIIAQGINFESHSASLENFVKKGGTLIEFPPSALINPSQRQVSWHFAELENISRVFKVQQWNQETGILANTSGGQPLPFSYFETRKRVLPVHGETLAYYNDGKPFLTREKKGKGFHFYFSTLPLTSWSNLEEGFLLVPIIQRIFQAIASPNQEFFKVCGRYESLEYQGALPVTGNPQDSPIENAGIYQINQSTIACNRPLEENDLTYVTKQEVIESLSSNNIQWLAQSSPEDVVKDEELWKVFLLLAIGFLLTEAFFSLPPRLKAAR